MSKERPIFVSEIGKRHNTNGAVVDWVDVWLTKKAITKLQKTGHLTVTDGGIIVRLMTAEDKIVINPEFNLTTKEKE